MSEIELAGGTFHWGQDVDFDPRRDCDNVATFCCFDHGGPRNETEYRKEQFNSWAEVRKRIKRDKNPRLVKELQLYEHGGVVLGFPETPFPDRRWDVRTVGFAYVRRRTARRELGWNCSDEDVERAVRGEARCWSDWANGDWYEAWFEMDSGEDDGVSGVTRDWLTNPESLAPWLPDAWSAEEVAEGVSGSS